MVRGFLVAFALIALFVATLSINNTFSITVAQRTRELAMLRSIGASSRQVRRMVTLEALIIGVVAALIGAVAGLGVAALLKGMFKAFGFGLPTGGLTVTPDVGGHRDRRRSAGDVARRACPCPPRSTCRPDRSAA